jgi:hypothetical protein
MSLSDRTGPYFANPGHPGFTLPHLGAFGILAIPFCMAQARPPSARSGPKNFGMTGHFGVKQDSQLPAFQKVWSAVF